MLAGFIAGVAGGLHVQIQHALAQNTYSPVDSITVFSTAVIGGLGSLTGAISGVLLFRYLETITALGDLRLLLTGTGLLVVLYALPGGFGQLMFSIRDRYLRWVANRHDIIVPSLVADKRGQENSVGLLQGALTENVVQAGSGGDHTICRCARCGTAVWSTYPRLGTLGYGVRVGTFDDPAAFRPDAAIFMESAMPWVTPPQGIPAFAQTYNPQELLPPERLARLMAMVERRLRRY